jgi:hypothetical protein
MIFSAAPAGDEYGKNVLELREKRCYLEKTNDSLSFLVLFD